MAYTYNQSSNFQSSASFDQGSAPSRTLWYIQTFVFTLKHVLTYTRMGELDPWMDESYLRQLFWSLGEEVTCRLSVDKYGGAYSFIEFQSHEGANKVLQNMNGTQIPNTTKYFRLNWSSRDGNGNPMPTKQVHTPELFIPVTNTFCSVVNNNWNNGFCIFVGDLGADVDDTVLMQGFLRYPSVRSAKVMIDTITGNSRGFGFVKFLNEADQLSSIDEMQGVYVGSRPIRISLARPRNRFEANVNVPENEITTVFVGCLNNTITEEELRVFFGQCGEILAIKMITNKNIAFIQYEKRAAAERSIAELNGAHLGGAKLRLSFGRTQLNSGMGA
jgi:RNA recognition motif-containing protein